jgi:hypothetical protein
MTVLARNSDNQIGTTVAIEITAAIRGDKG